MATSQYGVNNAATNKIWSAALFEETLKKCWVQKFVGDDSNSLIQRKTELQKRAGDRIRYLMRPQLTGAGVAGDSTMEGNEEAIQTFSDDLLIDQLRNAVRSDGQMTEQRIAFSIREESKAGLSDWFADRVDTAFFNQVCGNTNQTDLKYTGSNATVAPSSNNIVWINSLATEAAIASASASNIMKLTYIDSMVERAKTLTTKIRPVKVDGDEYFVLFLHPYQVTDLRTNTSTGQWLDIQKAAMQGGKVKDNGIFTGSLGIYNNVILHESTRIPQTTTVSATSGVYRAVLCGAQAAVIGYGQLSKGQEMGWVEESFDFENQTAIAGRMIWGLKKTVFNSNDFATLVLPTYAQQH